MSTASAWAMMTTRETGLAAEVALYTGWLEQRQHVDAGHLV